MPIKFKDLSQSKELPKEIASKIRTQAQLRYGDKTTNQHHEQACYIAGATAWAKIVMGFTAWANERYTWVEDDKWDGDNDETWNTETLLLEYIKTLP